MAKATGSSAVASTLDFHVQAVERQDLEPATPSLRASNH